MENEHFFKALSYQRSPSNELKTHFNGLLRKEVHQSHTRILEVGEVCSKMWFIVKGFAIAYDSKKSKKVPYWSWNDQEVMVPMRSFFKRTPMNCCIEVMEKSTLLSISYRAISALIERFPDFNILLMDLVEDFQKAAEKHIPNTTDIESYEDYELLRNQNRFITRKETVQEQEIVVCDFVGAGGPSYVDGIGEGAAFNRPNSMTTDAFGNIFVVDNVNLKIRKVTPDGVVSTFAGSGALGYQDGPQTLAQFGYYCQIASDTQNNLYLTDPYNSCIRKISSLGIFSTLVGAPERSYSDGPITTAGIELNADADITVDSSNNIYFLDKNGVRKIGINGIVSTIVQNGPSIIIGPIKMASIPRPMHICADKHGNLYVSSFHQENVIIFKISTEGIVSVHAGAIGGDLGYKLGLASVARFRKTIGMAADKSDNIFILDQNHVITKITPDGFVRLVAGTQYKGSARAFVPGPASQAVLHDSIDIAIDPNGIIYVLEDQGSSIRKIAPYKVKSSLPF